jgi:hypothetical protein
MVPLNRRLFDRLVSGQNRPLEVAIAITVDASYINPRHMLSNIHHCPISTLDVLHVPETQDIHASF